MADAELICRVRLVDPIDSVLRFIHHAIMEPIGIYRAHNELTSLLRRAAMAEEVVIAHDREPIARLVALAPREVQRLGIDEGKYIVPDDFNNPITEDGLDVFGL